MKALLLKPKVMGVINMSPNSFYQPCSTLDDALYLAEKMVAEGVDILDVGGEATNPFVKLEPAAIQQEIDRVVPVIAAISKRFGEVGISVDTSQPAVMQEAVNNGAHMVNDQRALRVPGAVEIVAKLQIPVCLMHMFYPEPRVPESSSSLSILATLLQTIKYELQESAQRCIAGGIDKEHIIIDPGFGQGNYGKNCEENFYLLSKLPELAELGYPILVGWSRKSMIGDVLGGVPPEQRLSGSIAAATIAALQGADIIRVHDVKETVDAIKVVQGVLEFDPMTR